MLQIADNASKYCRYYEDAIFRLHIHQSALRVPSLQRLQRMHSNLERALDEHGESLDVLVWSRLQNIFRCLSRMHAAVALYWQ
jgi:hypothetical protein